MAPVEQLTATVLQVTRTPPTEQQLHQNMTALRSYVHPQLMDYYTHLTPFITLSIFISALLFILNFCIFCTTVQMLRKRLFSPFLQSVVTLISFYPLIALMATITILVPILAFACQTIMHFSFTIGAIIFYRLCFRYVDSEINYVKETDGAAVELSTAPLCCCCRCLPGVSPSRGMFFVLRAMVYQMVIVQGSILVVSVVFYYNDRDLYNMVSAYFLPFLLCSILLGLWGLNITVRMVSTVRAEYGLMKKLFCLQLIMLLCKFQYMVLDTQLDVLDMEGPYPINHTIYKQTIISLLILSEMVLVSLLAQSAYKSPIQTLEE